MSKLENLYTTNRIRTRSGIYVDPFCVCSEEITIEDIAHALSYIPRWAGHTEVFYSVARHSLWCANNVEPKYKLSALLHDASEAYLMDIPKPIKNRLPDYIKLEDKVCKEIANKFGVEYPLDSKVKEVDRQALEWEWENVVISSNVAPKTSEEIKNEFLKLYKSLICNYIQV